MNMSRHVITVGVEVNGLEPVLQQIPQAAMMTPYRGPTLTLGDAATAHLRFMAWCKACVTAVNLTRATKRAGMGQRHQFLNRAAGWCARAAAAATSTWW